MYFVFLFKGILSVSIYWTCMSFRTCIFFFFFLTCSNKSLFIIIIIINYGFEKKAFEFSKALKMFKINFAPNFVIIKLSRSIYNTLINHF